MDTILRIPLGESYSSIRALADLSVCINIYQHRPHLLVERRGRRGTRAAAAVLGQRPAHEGKGEGEEVGYAVGQKEREGRGSPVTLFYFLSFFYFPYFLLCYFEMA